MAWKLLLAALAMFLLQPFVEAARPDVQTVPYVELNRYVGQWYEIASFPKRFQKGCVATTATYRLKNKDAVEVVNECRRNTFTGSKRLAWGTATIADAKTNAKLKVSFYWPFKADYWIIDLDKDYKYAVVATPDRDSLWILSRTPQLEESTYNEILKRAQAQHFDISRLQKTPQMEAVSEAKD